MDESALNPQEWEPEGHMLGTPAPFPAGWVDRDADAVAQAAGRRADELAVIDLAIAELATVELAQRIRASLNRRVDVTCRDGTRFAGTLRECGSGWLLLAELPAGRGSAALVPLDAITSLTGLSQHVEDADVRRQPTLGAVLRSWSASREKVRCGLVSGQVEGSIARVGRDAMDIAVHPLDRGPTLADPVVAVPMRALNWVVATT